MGAWGAEAIFLELLYFKTGVSTHGKKNIGRQNLQGLKIIHLAPYMKAANCIDMHLSIQLIPNVWPTKFHLIKAPWPI